MSNCYKFPVADKKLFDACLHGNMLKAQNAIDDGAKDTDFALTLSCGKGYLNIAKMVFDNGGRDIKAALRAARMGRHTDTIDWLEHKWRERGYPFSNLVLPGQLEYDWERHCSNC